MLFHRRHFVVAIVLLVSTLQSAVARMSHPLGSTTPPSNPVIRTLMDAPASRWDSILAADGNRITRDDLGGLCCYAIGLARTDVTRSLALAELTDYIGYFRRGKKYRSGLARLWVGSEMLMNNAAAVRQLIPKMISEGENAAAAGYFLRGQMELADSPDAAIVDLKDAIRLNAPYPWPDAHYSLGSAYLTQKRYSEALEEFREVLREDPRDDA